MSTLLAKVLQQLRRLEGPARPDSLPDAVLLERFARRRDEDAFAALVGRHGRMVLHVCRRVLGDADAAEDAFQAAFLTLARRADVVRPGALATWLYGTAQRVAWKARAAACRRRRREGTPLAGAAADSRPDPLTELSARELLAVVDEEIRRLPQAYQMPVVLCCLEGHTLEEAAGLLGWSPGSVKGRLERGRAQLHVRLTRRGLTLAAALAVLEVACGRAAGLPAPLVGATARLACADAAGSPVAETVAALAQAAWQGTGPCRRTVVATLLLALGVTASAVGWLLPAAGRQAPPEPAAAKRPGPVPAPNRPAPTYPNGQPLPAGVVARLGTVRLRHGGAVRSLAFADGGRELVSHSDADGVRFWDTATGNETGRLPPEAGVRVSMKCAALSPDGKQIITLENGADGGGGSTLRVWDRAGRKVVREFLSGGNLVDLRLSPDGKVMVVEEQFHHGYDRGVLDVATLMPLRRLEDGEKWGRGGAFSADGKTFVAGGEGVIRIWDVATGRKVREIAGGLRKVAEVALAPDGRLVATVEMELVRLDTGLAYVSDPFIRLWDVAGGKEVRRLTPPAGPPKVIRTLAFAADGRRLVSTGADGFVRFWDPATGKETGRVAVDPGGAGVAVLSPDGKTLAAVGGGMPFVPGNRDAPVRLLHGGGAAIRLIDRATGKDRLPHDDTRVGLFGTALTSDGKTAVTITADHALRLWDPRTGKERGRLEGHKQLVTAVRVLPDNRTLLTASLDGTLRVWDLAAGKEVRRLGVPFQGLGLFALSADGKTLALAQGEGVVAVVNLADGAVLRRLNVGGQGVEGVGFTADGKRLVVWTRDHTARVWDVAGGRELRQFRLDQGLGNPPGLAALGPRHFWEYAGAVSPDGRFVAYGNRFAFLAVYDTATGGQVLKLDRLPDQVATVAFTADGRTLAWSSFRDPTIRLVEVATGRERARLAGHRGRVHALTCSADGKLLVSGSEDTTALVWDLRGVFGPGAK